MPWRVATTEAIWHHGSPYTPPLAPGARGTMLAALDLPSIVDAPARARVRQRRTGREDGRAALRAAQAAHQRLRDARHRLTGAQGRPTVRPTRPHRPTRPLPRPRHGASRSPGRTAPPPPTCPWPGHREWRALPRVGRRRPGPRLRGRGGGRPSSAAPPTSCALRRHGTPRRRPTPPAPPCRRAPADRGGPGRQGLARGCAAGAQRRAPRVAECWRRGGGASAAGQGSHLLSPGQAPCHVAPAALAPARRARRRPVAGVAGAADPGGGDALGGACATRCATGPGSQALDARLTKTRAKQRGRRRAGPSGPAPAPPPRRPGSARPGGALRAADPRGRHGLRHVQDAGGDRDHTGRPLLSCHACPRLRHLAEAVSRRPPGGTRPRAHPRCLLGYSLVAPHLIEKIPPKPSRSATLTPRASTSAKPSPGSPCPRGAPPTRAPFRHGDCRPRRPRRLAHGRWREHRRAGLDRRLRAAPLGAPGSARPAGPADRPPSREARPRSTADRSARRRGSNACTRPGGAPGPSARTLRGACSAGPCGTPRGGAPPPPPLQPMPRALPQRHRTLPQVVRALTGVPGMASLNALGPGARPPVTLATLRPPVPAGGGRERHGPARPLACRTPVGLPPRRRAIRRLPRSRSPEAIRRARSLWSP